MKQFPFRKTKTHSQTTPLYPKDKKQTMIIALGDLGIEQKERRDNEKREKKVKNAIESQQTFTESERNFPTICNALVGIR